MLNINKLNTLFLVSLSLTAAFSHASSLSDRPAHKGYAGAAQISKDHSQLFSLEPYHGSASEKAKHYQEVGSKLQRAIYDGLFYSEEYSKNALIAFYRKRLEEASFYSKKEIEAYPIGEDRGFKFRIYKFPEEQSEPFLEIHNFDRSEKYVYFSKTVSLAQLDKIKQKGLDAKFGGVGGVTQREGLGFLFYKHDRGRMFLNAGYRSGWDDCFRDGATQILIRIPLEETLKLNLTWGSHEWFIAGTVIPPQYIYLEEGALPHFNASPTFQNAGQIIKAHKAFLPLHEIDLNPSLELLHKEAEVSQAEKLGSNELDYDAVDAIYEKILFHKYKREPLPGFSNKVARLNEIHKKQLKNAPGIFEELAIFLKEEDPVLRSIARDLASMTPQVFPELSLDVLKAILFDIDHDPGDTIFGLVSKLSLNHRVQIVNFAYSLLGTGNDIEKVMGAKILFLVAKVEDQLMSYASAVFSVLDYPNNLVQQVAMNWLKTYFTINKSLYQDVIKVLLNSNNERVANWVKELDLSLNANRDDNPFMKLIQSFR